MAGRNELCEICATVDLFSLFTGPRYFPHHIDGVHITQQLGTLKDVETNTYCPLCRLVKHDLLGDVTPLHYLWDYFKTLPDHSKVQCVLRAIRSDYDEDMAYENLDTRDLIATKLQTTLIETSECTVEERDRISNHGGSRGFKLLSPHSIDPLRPLMNGYPISTTKDNLVLLSQWFQTCRGSHDETCDLHALPTLDSSTESYTTRFIDVKNRTISRRPLKETQYAALSYVWGESKPHSTLLASHEDEQSKYFTEAKIALPLGVAKVVEDALYICDVLSIPYLWVDTYCINQYDLLQKAAEINAMGQIYRQAQITFIDGHGQDMETSQETTGLLPKNISDVVQRIETIGDRKYITCLPGTTRRFQASMWGTRSWTYQEGNLSKRVALFGSYDVTFMCGAGAWCESQHSGPYGHRADIPDLDMRSGGYHVLNANDWLRTTDWNFHLYESIISVYSGRDLSYESDKLNAIVGCLNIIAHRMGLEFIHGLPSLDFHYALLWTHEQDEPRNGFPSWSWAGWHSVQQTYWFHPQQGTSGRLVESQNVGEYDYRAPASMEVKLAGAFINGIERSHQPNQCIQRLAELRVFKHSSALRISSEVAHFSLDIASSRPSVDDHTSWNDEEGYYVKFILRDQAGRQHAEPSPYHYRPWPQVRISFPGPLKGPTITWLLREGISLIRVMDVEMLVGDAGGDPLPARRVSCLGIDRRQGNVRRFGTVHMNGEMWDQAEPEAATIEMF